jgi:hypothetical protein
MRVLLAAALAALCYAVPAAQAQSQTQTQVQRQNPPYDMWCRDQPTGEGLVFICMAYTQQQCLDSRTGPGESCYLNPRYDTRFRRQ